MQRRNMLIAGLLVFPSATVHAGLLSDIAKAVSITVITDAARASVSAFSATKVVQGNAFDRAKVKEILHNATNRDYPDAEKKKLYASKVDWVHRGVVDAETVITVWRAHFNKYPTYRAEVVSIDLIEVDPDKKFAAVSYTIRASWRSTDGRPGERVSKNVALFGSFRDSPRIHAIKRAA